MKQNNSEATRPEKAQGWRMAAYSLAAGASPFLAGEADAAIVPFAINQEVPFDGSAFLIDVNGDGNDDFNAQNRPITLYNGSWQVLYTTEPGSARGDFPDGLKITTESYNVPGVGDFSYATPQNPGQVVDGSGMYSYFANLTYGGLGPAIGDLNAGPILLGFELGIAGEKHFGWIRVSVDLTDTNNPVYEILDGAYQDVPGAPIAAGAIIPEPASLGLLAAGAAGLACYRHRKAS